VSKPRQGETGEALNADTVRHVAAIARLRLTEDEVERLQDEAQAILAYFDDVKDTPTEEQVKSAGAEALLRDDVSSGPDHGAVDEMVGTFKKTKDRHLLVPRGL
jgi:aspartyl/glutamyl-tRNA(Asn/Gln) amidotransferase C subunit